MSLCMLHTRADVCSIHRATHSGVSDPYFLVHAYHLAPALGKMAPIDRGSRGERGGAALKTAARLTAATHCYWTPVCGIRAPTHSPAPRRGAGSCVGRCLFIEPVPSLRRGWRPALAPHRSSGRLAPPLGLRRSVPSVRCGRDNPTRLRRATRSPLLLGPEQARVSAWGLRPSVLGTVGARLRVGEVEADGAFSSARCARLGARTTSAKPLASGLPAPAAAAAAAPPTLVLGTAAPRSREGRPAPPACPPPSCSGGARPAADAAQRPCKPRRRAFRAQAVP